MHPMSARIMEINGRPNRVVHQIGGSKISLGCGKNADSRFCKQVLKRTEKRYQAHLPFS